LATPVKVEGWWISAARTLGECHLAVTVAMADSERNVE